jgi:hypothetical protein
MSRRVWAVIGAVLIGWAAGAFSHAADGPAEATVTDAEGKEVKVSGLKFGAGARRLAWLADPSGTTDEAKKGPLALELREPHSTSYTKGIITFVPMSAVESIKYDYEKQVAAVAIKGLTEPLAGTLQYKGINVLAFDGSADGKAAKFSGGAFTKGNIKAVAFAGATAPPARKGVAQWSIQIDQPTAMNPTLRANNFKFLYHFPNGTEILTDSVPTHKSDPLKLDDALKGYTTLAIDAKTQVVAAEVQVGETERVIVIHPELEKDGKTGTLAGLLGEVEAGWKLFPLHTIKSIKRVKKD